MSRYTAYAASIALAFGALALAQWHPHAWWAVAVFAGLALLGTLDMLQRKSTLRRNFPDPGAFSLWAGNHRPGDAAVLHPVRYRAVSAPRATRVDLPACQARQRRAPVWHLAGRVWRGLRMDQPFRWRTPKWPITIFVSRSARTARSRIRPVLNISAMSFGALSAAAIRALNGGAKRRVLSRHRRRLDFAVSPRGRRGIWWELGSGYFGCRNHDGSFNAQRFTEQARDAGENDRGQVTVGAKPGHGGALSAKPNSARNCRHRRCADGPGLRLAGAPFSILHAAGGA